MQIIAAIILITIVLTARLAYKWSLPLILISLASGIIFGSDVLGVVYFDNMILTKQIADTALIFVLFTGGFGTRRETFKMVMVPAVILSTLGVILTALVTGLSFWIFFKYSFPFACLLGSIIASTDAAAVFSILRSRSLSPKLTAITEVESATNDPMAIILTTFMLEILAFKYVSPFQLVLIFSWQLLGGIALGIGIGYAGYALFKRVKGIDKSYFYILIISIILFSFGLTDLLKSSGMLSAFFAGYIMGNTNFPFKRNISAFLNAISTVSNVVIFVILGLLVFPHQFESIWLKGVVLFLVLTFISRPISILICTIFSRFCIKEKIFLSWSGLRGAVPVVLATYPAASGMKESTDIFNIIFFAVTLSIIIQGVSIGKIADLLKLSIKSKPKPEQVMELVTIQDSDLDLYELHIDEDLYEGSASVSSFKFDNNTTITMINRRERIIAPHGGTIVYPGDVLYILTHNQNIHNVVSEVLSHFQSKQ